MNTNFVMFYTVSIEMFETIKPKNTGKWIICLLKLVYYLENFMNISTFLDFSEGVKVTATHLKLCINHKGLMGDMLTYTVEHYFENVIMFQSYKFWFK